MNQGECHENDARYYEDETEYVLNATWCDCAATAGAVSGHAFEGEYCERIPPCESSPCLFGGVCVAGPGDNTYTCDCSGTESPISSDPYTGTHCEMDADTPCSYLPCQNDGVCSDDGHGSAFSCACDGGWLGATCSIPPVDKCTAGVCGAFGVCIPSTISTASSIPAFARCVCTHGYSGVDCSVPPSVCTDKCQNNGVCIHDAHLDAGDSLNFACICPPPFVGQYCQWNETQWNSAPSTTLGLLPALVLAVFAILY